MKEEGLAYRIADRIVSIHDVEGGFDYSIMNLQYMEIDGGVYDNPDIDIREALKNIVDDLKNNPDHNGSKGKIQISDKLEPLDYSDVTEKAEIENMLGTTVYQSHEVMEFKAKTAEKFHNIGYHNVESIEETVEVFIQSIIDAYELDAKIRGVAITGSRARGLENSNSDLDIVVELDTYEKEDFLFNIFNDYDLCIDDVKVDINPITKYQTGNLEQYLKIAEIYLQRKADKMEIGNELYEAVKKNDIKRVRDLLEQGADVNYVYCPDKYGYTPLHMAAYFASGKIVEMLLEKGCNVNPISVDGKTPLALAQERHNYDSITGILELYGGSNCTAPMPDFAGIGDVFLTTRNKYLIINEDKKVKEYDKDKLDKVLEARSKMNGLGKEVEIDFEDGKYFNAQTYYSFSLEKIQNAEKKIAEEDVKKEEHQEQSKRKLPDQESNFRRIKHGR